MVSNGEYKSLMIDEFVASFEKLDEMYAFKDLDFVEWQFAVGEPDEHGGAAWRPRKVATLIEALDAVYSKLPARFPPLYEQLLLSYRWAEVDLQSCRLLANPMGSDFQGLIEEMSRDSAIWNALRPAGYKQFGKGPDLNYDPVCFDIKSRKKKRECRIVQIDHEEILCNYKVKVVAELAPSFFELLQDTITLASRAQGTR